jgi:hypothetical protein
MDSTSVTRVPPIRSTMLAPAYDTSVPWARVAVSAGRDICRRPGTTAVPGRASGTESGPGRPCGHGGRDQASTISRRVGRDQASTASRPRQTGPGLHGLAATTDGTSSPRPRRRDGRDQGSTRLVAGADGIWPGRPRGHHRRDQASTASRPRPARTGPRGLAVAGPDQASAASTASRPRLRASAISIVRRVWNSMAVSAVSSGGISPLAETWLVPYGLPIWNWIGSA